MSVIKSLLKGLQALDLLVAGAVPVRTLDVASTLGVDKSAASRILQTLVAAGYAAQTQDRRYTPGPKMKPGKTLPLTDMVSLREQARPLLEKLTGEWGECAHLAVLVGSKVLYLDKIEPQQSLKVDQPVGTLAPLHCTAFGKVFLAFGGSPIPTQLDRYTPRTVTEPELLAAQMKSTAKSGFAVDDEEYSLGVRCVAAPLWDRDGGMVGAIGLSGPTARISLERLAEMGDYVRETANRFSVEPAKTPGAREVAR